MHAANQDAADIRAEDGLFRRITTVDHTSKQPDGTRLLTSFAFRENNDEFSMYVAAEITREKVLSCGQPGQEVIEIQAGQVRRLGYILIRDPDVCDDSHIYAKATSYKSDKQVRRDCKALAEIVNDQRMRSQ